MDTRIGLFTGILAATCFQSVLASAQAVAPSPSELQKMKDLVASLNADQGTARKTLKRHTGQLVDCTDYDKQPAFRDLRKKGQPVPPMATVDMSILADWNSGLDGTVSPATPEPLLDPTDTFPADLSAVPASAAKRCDPGTVPILRTDLKAITKFRTLDAYFASLKSVERNSSNPPGFFHAGVDDADTVRALQAYLNCQKPPRMGPLGDHSTLQLYIQDDPDPKATNFHTIEMGLDVDRELYGDDWVHTLVYASTHPGHNYCIFWKYCEGSENVTYHQQSSDYFPTGSWGAGSATGFVKMGILSGSAGGQDALVYCVLDQIMGWVYKSETNFNGSATLSKVFGEVYSTTLDTTTTAMGSGVNPNTLSKNYWPNVAWAADLQVFRTADNYWSDFAIQDIGTYNPCRVNEFACYDVKACDTPHQAGNCPSANRLQPGDAPWSGWGTFMFFGGQGNYNSPSCN